MKFRTLLAVPFIALSIAGCGSSGGGGSGGGATLPADAVVIKAVEGIAWDAKSYTATAVEGKVSYGGEPIDVGTITFLPASGSGIKGGGLIENGSYQVDPKLGLGTGPHRVEIHWTVEEVDNDCVLTLSWTEQNGPPVTAPTRSGFGSRLIKHGFSAEHSSTVSLAFEPEGLICTIAARLPRPTA